MIEILTAEELGEMLRLSGSRVLILAKRGEIPYLLIDGRIRFDAVEIEAWLKTQKPCSSIERRTGN